MGVLWRSALELHVSMRLSFFIVFFFITSFIFGQSDSTVVILIDEISIIDSSSNLTFNNKSLYSTLSEHAAIIRDQGYGQLATYSRDGLPSRFTPISINGILVQSPNTGVADLNLLSNYRGDVQLSSRGIIKESDYQNKIGLELISTRELKPFIQLASQSKHQNHSIQLAGKIASLRIRYRDRFNNRDITDPTPQRGIGFLHSSEINYNHHHFRIRSLANAATRKYLPTLTTNSNIWQRDKQFGVSGEYENTHVPIAFKLSGYSEQFQYIDSTTLVKSASKASQLRFETRYVLNFSPRFKLRPSIVSRFDRGQILETVDGSQYAIETRLPIFLAYKKMFISSHFGLLTTNKRLHPTARLFVGSQITPSLLLQADFEHRIQLPALNDLFWPISGNPNLKPEELTSLQFKLTHDIELNDQHSIQLESRVFTHYIRNYIQWYPNTQGQFEAQQIGKSLHRGFDIKANSQFSTKDFLFKSQAIYRFNRSTPLVHPNQLAEKKQYIFTPQHNVSAFISCQYKNYELRYSINGSSKIPSNNSGDFLEPYLIHNMQAGAQFNQYFISLQANNLFGAQYQTSPNVISPLQIYAIQANYNF